MGTYLLKKLMSWEHPHIMWDTYYCPNYYEPPIIGVKCTPEISENFHTFFSPTKSTPVSSSPSPSLSISSSPSLSISSSPSLSISESESESWSISPSPSEEDY